MARRSTAEAQEETPTLHPKFAEHLVAHADKEKQLLNLINARRLPHAMLFTGPRGIGKATLAWRLARFLITPQETGGGLFGDPLPPESLHVPATHSIFRRMAAGAHPDFLVLEADDIKVEEARSVAAFLSLTPAESQWRVVIIDSADAMNRNAANALLKTLEEPPPNAVLLLISHNPGDLLPTIRSRCRMIRMAPLSAGDFAKILGSVQPDIAPMQMQSYALLSANSPGVALTLIEARAEGIYKELLERVSSFDTLKNHGFADKFARKDAQDEWKVLNRLFMWMLMRITAQRGGMEVFLGEQALLEGLRAKKPLDAWLELWEKARLLLADTEHLHLERKQVILTLLRAAGE